MKANTLLCLFCALLSACAAAPSSDEPAPVKPTPTLADKPARAASNDVDSLLMYYHSLRDLPQSELTREFAALAAQPKSARLSLQKSMVLALNHGSGDLARSQALADGIARSAEPDAMPLKPLAQFLAANYAETRRLADQVDKLNQQTRESQRRIDQLNETLEALKAIERTLPARPNVSAPAPIAK
jgi:hypothetical protein